MTAANTLELIDLSVEVSGKTVCRNIDLTVPEGELHVLFGPNGSGKSSLLAAIMGLPPFRITRGEIRLGGERIDNLPTDERAARGVGMSFQRPPSLPGVSVREFSEAVGGLAHLPQAAELLNLDEFIDRDVNAGFSGGEIKRWEILKLFLQQPRFMLFDEPESGVDLEHIAAVGKAINELVRSLDTQSHPRSALVITHTGFVLDYVRAETGHMLIDGRLVHSGDAQQMFRSIQQHGYRTPAA